MRKHRSKHGHPLDITEAVVPLAGWPAEHGTGYAGLIEQDIRSFIRQIAEQKHAASEQDRESHEALRRLFLELLDVLDAYENVFRDVNAKKEEVSKQMRKWVDNFRTIYRLTHRVLSDRGVSRIESLDGTFDPRWHRVVQKVKSSTHPEGAVVEERRGGYLWNGVVLRKAEVVIAGEQEHTGGSHGGQNHRD